MTDFKRRMQNLSTRIDQLLAMIKASKKKPTHIPQSVLVKRIIAKNQEILCEAASQVYGLHETVASFETMLDLENLCLTDDSVRGLNLQTSNFPENPDRYPDRFGLLTFPLADSAKDAGPPPLEPAGGAAAAGDWRNLFRDDPRHPRRERTAKFTNDYVEYINLSGPPGGSSFREQYSQR